MLLRSLLVLGTLAASAAAQDGIHARQNDSSPAEYAASSAEYTPSPTPESVVEVVSSVPAKTESVAEPAPSYAAQPEPTPTDSKKTEDYNTNTDDCEHWGSKCPWGKTVTVTEKVKETQTATETVWKTTETTVTTEKPTTLTTT